MSSSPLNSPASQRTGIALILFGALVVGLMPSAAKIAYQEGANPLAVILLRSLVGVVGIGIYMLIRRYPFDIGWKAFQSSSITGVSQSLTSIGVMGSVAYIDVSLAMVIVFCFPFWVSIFNHYSGSTKLTLIILLCFTSALIGLGFVLGVNLGGLNVTGISLAVLGMFSMAIMVVIVSDSSKKIGPVTANFFMTGWTAVYFLIIAIFAPKLGLLENAIYPNTDLGWIAILGTGISFTLGYVLFFLGAAIIGTTRASILSISEPVMIILVAIFLVDEWLTSLQWFGIMLVIGSLVVIELPKKTPK